MLQVNWATPQRQPIAGLVIVLLKTFWEIAKRVWPLLLIMLFRKEDDTTDNRNLIYELILIGISSLAILSGVLRFFFFHFYIQHNELVVKKGWIKKETVVIPLQKIQTVHIEQSMVHEVLNIVKLSIDTAGSTKTEVAIDALRRPMAEALRYQLLETEKEFIPEHEQVSPGKPLIRLTGGDLARLSISANHLEAFFIILSFVLGIFDNLRNINDNAFSDAEGLVRSSTSLLWMFFIPALLILVFIVSSARIVFKFFDFTVFAATSGYRIKSGLTNVKERTVSFPKIQYVSWHASWIRRLMNLWMLEYHVSGSDEQKRSMRVQVPITNESFIPVLAQNYNALPSTEGVEPVRIHPSYVYRRLLLLGLFPAAALLGILWPLWGERAFFILGYPLLVGISLWLYRRKFRLWAFSDVLFIRKGYLGEGFTLLNWHKIQAVALKQSIHERRRSLATVVLHTASGNITVRYIPLEKAQQIINYALYQVEHSARAWM